MFALNNCFVQLLYSNYNPILPNRKVFKPFILRYIMKNKLTLNERERIYKALPNPTMITEPIILEEFNLSEKEVMSVDEGFYAEEDVKEFIRIFRLEDLDWLAELNPDIYNKVVFRLLKRAGDELK